MVETIRRPRITNVAEASSVKKSLRFKLKEKLRSQELNSLRRSYDIVGDIAVVKVTEGLGSQSRIIAEAIMRTHKQVRTVLRQVSAVSGEYRLRQLEWIMGEDKTETVQREFGCVFKVDLKTCYFSPRLSFERMRIARLVKPDEVVVNMFAGVGSFSILMAKHGGARRVYSIDLNPDAVEYMRENIRLNRVQDRVVPALGDAKQIIVVHLVNVADRVVMPLPEKAYYYLDYAVGALKPDGGWIHYYDFEHASKREDPIENSKAKVSDKLRRLGVGFTLSFGRVVRPTGPNWFQVVLDIKVNHKKAFSTERSRHIITPP